VQVSHNYNDTAKAETPFRVVKKTRLYFFVKCEEVSLAGWFLNSLRTLDKQGGVG